MTGDVPDRQYNAADYSDNLAVVISSGVLRSTNDDLKVTAAGMAVSVAAGRAWIKGHYYNNTDVYNFAATTAPTGGSRYDRVMLRLNESINGRSISLVYVQGTAANNPVPPAPTRNTDIYDLVLADIYVGANATSVTVTDKRANTTLCGWVYSTSGDGSFFTSLDNSFNEWFNNAKNTLSSVTLFKRYTDKITLASAASAVSFNIPQYDAETCFIEVYVNGILDTRYTLNNNVITFAGSLIAGTVVTVYAFKSIDGTDIMSVADEITELQNKVAQLDGVAKFTYKCTGLNDNISLSQIAQAFYKGSYVAADVTTAAAAFLSALGGNTYLAAMQPDAQAEIDVVGELYANVAYKGDGSSASPYKYFVLGNETASDKKIVFNFAKCGKIYVDCPANSSNVVFAAVNQYIKCCKLVAQSNGAGCSITVASGQSGSKYYFDECDFSVTASNYAIIATTGNFNNCKGVTKGGVYSRCFDIPTFGFVRLNGGTYYAYGTQNAPTIVYTAGASTSALLMAYNINTPVVGQTGYYQDYLGVINAGKAVINGVVNYSLKKAGAGLVVTNEVVMNKAD